MNRRPRLPGADELFRSTGGPSPRSGLVKGLVEVGQADRDDRDDGVDRAGRAPSSSGTEMDVDMGAGGSGVRAARGSTQAIRRAAVATSATVDPSSDGGWDFAEPAPVRPVRIARRGADAKPTGRERHDEKITVYCSPEELLQIEQARLTLRGSHGVAVDRGRIVREAVALVLADLEAKGDASILVRRLRGR
ncbi:MAG: hypothetical protein ACRDV3_07200 [Acidothermaceae bacterium]